MDPAGAGADAMVLVGTVAGEAVRTPELLETLRKQAIEPRIRFLEDVLGELPERGAVRTGIDVHPIATMCIGAYFAASYRGEPDRDTEDTSADVAAVLWPAIVADPPATARRSTAHGRGRTAPGAENTLPTSLRANSFKETHMADISTNTAVVDEYFRAIERGDIDTVRALYAPDAVVWHNDGAGDQSLEDNLTVLRLFSDAIRDLRFDVSRRVDVGDGVFQQHVLRGWLPGGEEVALDTVMYLAVAGGRITRIEEYFDVATVTRIIAGAENAAGV